MIVLAAVLVDLCGQPPALAAEPDLADAAAYVQAADDARAAEDLRIAALAYRKALANDPSNAHAKQALDELCRADRGVADASALADAIALFGAGDLGGARDRFEALGTAGAHFFLGLIALRDHDGARAARELELAGRDPAYADAVAGLLRLARRDGALALTMLVEPEVDTNPQLVPDTPAAGATTGPPQTDGDLLLVGAITARPWRWLALRDVLAWRNQMSLSELDYIGETAQVALELDGRADHLAIRYDLAYDVLGGSPYLVASRGAAGYRHDLGALGLTAGYALQRRDYQQPAQASFTGWVHAADLGMTLHATPQLDVELRALGWREITQDLSFSDLAGGAQLAVRVRPSSRVRVTASGAMWYAHYDAAEPDGALRRDAHGDGSLDVEVDLGDHVIAVAGASVARNDSTIEDFRYWKIVGRAGLAFAFGAL